MKKNLCSKCRSRKRKLCTQNREISSDWVCRGKARECPGNLAVGKSPFPWERKGAWEFNDTCDLPTVLMTLSQGHKIGEAARVKSSPRYVSSHSCRNSLRMTFISFYLRCSIKKTFLFYLSIVFQKENLSLWLQHFPRSQAHLFEIFHTSASIFRLYMIVSAAFICSVTEFRAAHSWLKCCSPREIDFRRKIDFPQEIKIFFRFSFQSWKIAHDSWRSIIKDKAIMWCVRLVT